MNLGSIKDELKGILSITWLDEVTETRLTNLINNAAPTLNFKVGAELDYDVPGQERGLLLNYCMYAWNNCINDFSDNYANDIMQLRIKYEVEQYNQELNEVLNE